MYSNGNISEILVVFKRKILGQVNCKIRYCQEKNVGKKGKSHAIYVGMEGRYLANNHTCGRKGRFR